MIRVRYYPGEMRLRMDGHAGAGERGQDIVCAGASALMFTLIGAAEDVPEYGMHAQINEKEASVEVRCYPDDKHEKRCRYLFDTIALGLGMLAEKYPDNIVIGGSYGTD